VTRTLDTTEVGMVAAAVMEDLQRADNTGEFGTGDRKVVAVAIVWEVRHDRDQDDDPADNGGAYSSAGVRATDNWNTLARGLLNRGQEILGDPDANDLTQPDED
jgi:hypothetical protein